jgi:pimeloyl-ACP methyl ester carboxylesterase
MTKKKHFYLIRGLIREKGHWGDFITQLEKKFPESKITGIDLPGAGDYYQSTSPLSVREIVEEMRKDYLKLKLDQEDSHLVAVSLGGMIALEWMRNYSEDFHRATLINTSFGGISPFYQRLLPKAFLFLLKVPFLKGREKESRILELVTNNKDIFHETLNLWEKIQKDRPVSLDNTLRQLFAAGLFKAKDFIPTVPVSLIASTKDRMVSVECSRAISKKWNVPLVEHPTGGHDLTADDPEWVADKIKKESSL